MLSKKRGKDTTIFFNNKISGKNIFVPAFFVHLQNVTFATTAMSLSVQNISKRYGNQQVLDRVNFNLEVGEIVGFLGPNGAGKSTLMKIIAGFVLPDEGVVEVCGHKVATDDIVTKRLVGYLPEHNPLYLDMYVTEYLNFVAGFYAIDDKRRRIAEMIERTGLGAESRKKIGQLSKGYRQRVGLAQAMLHNPQVLILDEPTTGLDPNQIVEIRRLISDFGKDRTVLFSTHIMQEVQALCRRVVIIDKGKIVADAAERDIMCQSKEALFEVEIKEHATVSDFADLSDKISSVKAIADGKFEIAATQDIRQELFSLAMHKQWTILTLKEIESSMEDIFRQLTNND